MCVYKCLCVCMSVCVCMCEGVCMNLCEGVCMNVCVCLFSSVLLTCVAVPSLIPHVVCRLCQ